MVIIYTILGKRINQNVNILKKLITFICIAAFAIISSSATAQLNKAYFYYQGQRLITQDKFTEAIGYLNILIDVDSTLAEGWFLRGVAKYYLNDLQGSKNDLSKSISKNPLLTIAYHYRAIVNNRLGRYNEAFRDLEFALELRPEDQEILFTRGGTYIQTKQYSKAIQDYSRVIRSAPNNIDSWINRGIAKLSSSDTLGALTDFSQAIKLNPFYSESYSKRSRLYLEKKEFDIALSDISQAIYLDSISTMNYFIRGLIYNSKRNYMAALKDFNKVLSIDPKNSLSLYNRALIKTQTGALNSALEDYDILSKLNPNNVLVFYNRASVNYELGKYQKAIDDYSTAIALFPDFANAYFNRSIAKSRIGNNAGAEEDYRIASNKVQKYKASSQEAYLAMADTSKKFNNLLEFDTDFDNGFSEINLKNDINLPTGFLPFIKLQLIGETTKTSFRDFKKPFIDELNGNVETGYQYAYAQLSNASQQPGKTKYNLDTNAVSKSIVYFIKGVQLSALNKYSQAVQEYEKAQKYERGNQIIALNLTTEKVEMARFVEQFSNDANAVSFKMGNIGNENNDQGKSTNYTYSEAIDQLKGIEIDLPDLAVVPYNIGNTYLLTEELELAVNEYDKAIRIEPRFAEAWFNRGLVRLIKGDKQNGCIDISKAGELGLNQSYSLIQKFCK
jgi:tetratricopeptide (TPR) repeat protein